MKPNGAGGCHTTIQAAINAANAGDTIHVSAGTYNENVVINKNDITLTGALVLNPNDAPDDSIHTIINGGAPIVITSPGISIPNGVTGGTIQNLRVQGFASNSDIHGATNNNLTIDSVHVYSNNTNNATNDIGIQTGNFSKANPGATGSISNNEINAWRMGMFHNLWHSNASVIPVAGNTVNALDRAGIPSRNSILISSFQQTLNAFVIDNTITMGVISQNPASGYVYADQRRADHFRRDDDRRDRRRQLLPQPVRHPRSDGDLPAAYLQPDPSVSLYE